MRSARTARPVRLIATLWVVSMVVSWAGGTLMIGFDLGTTLLWLAFLILGPVLVWTFAAAAQAQPNPRDPAPRQNRPTRSAAQQSTPRRSRMPITRELELPPRTR